MRHNTKFLSLLAGAVTAIVLATTGFLWAAEPPAAEIGNGLIKAEIYLPDAVNGFYRSTRFDWSGQIASLEYKGHDFYGPWFYKVDPAVYDVEYDAKGVISGRFAAAVGPCEEFNTDDSALGFAEARPGGTFVKIGVGVLRKPQVGEPHVPTPPAGGGAAASRSERYDHSRVYELVDTGKWSVKKTANSVEFTQVLNDDADGYSYVYRKLIRLVPGKPEMEMVHTLKNTGKKPIKSIVYDHNFVTLDHQGPSKDFTITVPFQIKSPRPPTPGMLEVRGNQLVYVKTLEGADNATAILHGFGDTPKDNDIRVENKKLGAGYRVTGDRPLLNMAVWSTRTVNAVEPFISTGSIEPGKEFSWNLHYEYFTAK